MREHEDLQDFGIPLIQIGDILTMSDETGAMGQYYCESCYEDSRGSNWDQRLTLRRLSDQALFDTTIREAWSRTVDIIYRKG